MNRKFSMSHVLVKGWLAVPIWKQLYHLELMFLG